MRTKTFKCRFPGCKALYSLPQHRGRHESMAHGMVKGKLLQEYTTVNGAPRATATDLVAAVGRMESTAATNGNGHLSPVEHVRAALSSLEARGRALSAEIVRLDVLQSEASAVNLNITVLTEALDKLTATALEK